MAWPPIPTISADGGSPAQSKDFPGTLLAVICQSPLRLTPPPGLVLFYGHPALLRLGLCAATERALAGESVLYLDGANAFDPYVISRVARARGTSPRAVLQAIRVSRAFTCHQMTRLVTDRLAPVLHTSRTRVVILSGPLETFYDETVPADEVTRLADALFAALTHFARNGCRVLCLCPPVPVQAKARLFLLKRLYAHADRVLSLEESTDGLSLREEMPSADKIWRIPRAVWERL